MAQENLEIVGINSFKDLEISKFNIPEPIKSLAASEQTDFDLILVPGVAFDSKCNRIGYGKGFYDKLLKKITPALQN
jgi:5-formyltetrahydrofolate cyclo-ligase